MTAHAWIPRLEDEETEEEQYAAFRSRQHNRPPRKSGWAKGQPRCGVCSLFISTPGALCACGFDNGSGRYLSAA